jgi:hypothetical protein
MDAVRIVLYHLTPPCASVARQMSRVKKKEGSKCSPLSDIKRNVIDLAVLERNGNRYWC